MPKLTVLRGAKRARAIKLYDPEEEVLSDEPLVIQEGSGFMTWNPMQWGMFLAALATFIATVANVLTGNPVGIPLAG